MKVPWSRCLLTIIMLTGISTGVSIVRAEEHAYIGAKKCKMCHIKEYKSWAETKMAKSFDVLLPGERAEEKKAAGLDPDKDYTTDADCVRCHSTGYGKLGGFTDMDSTPDLAGVGCEMCHGAGGTYIQDEFMSLKNKEYKKAEVVAVGMVEQVTADQCTVCHNADSPFVDEGFVFDFETQKNEGTHEKYPLKYTH